MRKIISILIGIFLPVIAFADGKHLSEYGFDCTLIGFTVPGCGSMNTANYFTTVGVTKVVGTALAIATPLATIAFLYGAVRMVISRGDEGKEAGKKAMIYGALGLVFVMLADGIVKIVYEYVELLS